jgi:hypothetical protein
MELWAIEMSSLNIYNLKHSDYYLYHLLCHEKLSTPPTRCISVFRMAFRNNSYYFMKGSQLSDLGTGSHGM